MRTNAWMKRNSRGIVRAPAMAIMAAGTVILGGCDLGVSNPAQVEETDLNTVNAVPAIVTGAQHTFGMATTIMGGGGVYHVSALLTDELVHSGSWVPLREISEGIGGNESPENQSHWGFSSRARWQAEDALEKARELVASPASDRWVATAALYAGLSNRLMGDMFCDAVVNGGAKQPHTAFHERSIGYFTDAIAVAQAGGHTALLNAARGGRAQAYMMLGQWPQAVADAQQVATSFVYAQIHSENSGNENNGVHNWTFRGDNGNQATVWGTPFQGWGTEINGVGTFEGDPRVRYRAARNAAGAQTNGGDNRRPLFYAQKYPARSTSIPIVKGTEMRLIQAEAAIRSGDVPGAVALINQVRSQHNLPAASAGITNEAWDLLMKERGLELWLEGRRLPDLRRWASQPATAARAGFMVKRGVAFGQPAANDPSENVLNASPLCLRVSTNEIFSNPNLQSNPPR